MKDTKLRKRLFGSQYKSLNVFKGEGLIIRLIQKERDRIVKCEKCKCYVSREDAIKGEPEIRDIGVKGCYEVIYTPYYCHRCVPKKLKSKKQE